MTFRRDLEAASGVEFQIKDFRSTFGQNYIDKTGDTASVSKAMRHSTTKSTETYYGRVRSETAFQCLEQADERLVQVVKPSD